MRATLEIEHENPQMVKDAIEADENRSQRMRIDSSVDGGRLVVQIDADDFAALRAGVTSYLRLVKVCMV